VCVIKQNSNKVNLDYFY